MFVRTLADVYYKHVLPARVVRACPMETVGWVERAQATKQRSIAGCCACVCVCRKQLDVHDETALCKGRCDRLVLLSFVRLLEALLSAEGLNCE